MPEFCKSTQIALPAELVWAFHARPGAFQRLMPPWQRLMIRSWSGTLADARLQFDICQGPMKIRWVAEHDPADFIDGQQFVDVMRKGPASRWRHTHRVRPLGAASCELHDQIAYALPLHPMSHWLAGGWFKRDLERLFAFRHARTINDAWRHGRFAGSPRKRIVISGSSGVIGSALVSYLINAGHTVDRLVRRAPQNTGDGTPHLPGREFQWDPAATAPDESLVAALDGCDAVIHLAGAGIAARRWSEEYKHELFASRVKSTALLARAAQLCARPPGAMLVASGVNIYMPAKPGDTAPRDELAQLGDGFLARLACEWERATEPAMSVCRVANLRLGVVLARAGGFLRAPGVGTRPLGLSQFARPDAIVPWVHIDDALAAIEHVLHTDALRGPINIAAPAIDDHREVLQAVRRAAGTWLGLPVPRPAVRLLAGEVADHAFASQPISPAKLIASGFRFAVRSVTDAVGIEFGEHETLNRHGAALQALLSHPPSVPASPVMAD